MGSDRRQDMIDVIALYFEACNEVDGEKFKRCLTDDVIHYLPEGMGGPIVGIDAVVERWGADVRANGSYWTTQTIAADPAALTGVCEWTGVKPGLRSVLRGAEVYLFSEDLMIKEVHIYYASPRDDSRPRNQLAGYSYPDQREIDGVIS